MPTRPDLARLTVSQLHELTGRDRRWIKGRLAEKGIEPAEETARERRYRARDALAALYAVDGLDAAQERARLDRARAELAELKLEEERGELVRGDQVDEWAMRLLGAFTQRIRAIGPKAGPLARATATDSEAEAVVSGLVDEALTEIADAAREAGERVRRRKAAA